MYEGFPTNDKYVSKSLGFGNSGFLIQGRGLRILGNLVRSGRVMV